MGFDVQGGGSDLVFPHHEYSAVHAEALTATKPFARAYVHAAMIGLDGEKMSKSRGNLVFVSRLRGEGVDPMAIRLALLSGHYRTDRAWTADLLQRGRAAAGHLAAGGGPGRRARPPAPLLAGLRERLADDLDSPGAIALSTTGPRARLAEAAADARPVAEATGDWDEQSPAVVRDLARRAARASRSGTADDGRAVPVHRPGRPGGGRGAAGAGRRPVRRRAGAAPGPSPRTRCGRRSSATATGSCTPRPSAGSSTRRRSS